MPRLGMGEWVVILIVVLIIFGVGKLPEIGSGLGKGIRNFKKGIKGDEQDEHDKDSSHNPSKLN